MVIPALRVMRRKDTEFTHSRYLEFWRNSAGVHVIPVRVLVWLKQLWHWIGFHSKSQLNTDQESMWNTTCFSSSIELESSITTHRLPLSEKHSATCSKRLLGLAWLLVFLFLLVVTIGWDRWTRWTHTALVTSCSSVVANCDTGPCPERVDCSFLVERARWQCVTEWSSAVHHKHDCLNCQSVMTRTNRWAVHGDVKAIRKRTIHWHWFGAIKNKSERHEQQQEHFADMFKEGEKITRDSKLITKRCANYYQVPWGSKSFVNWATMFMWLLWLTYISYVLATNWKGNLTSGNIFNSCTVLKCLVSDEPSTGELCTVFVSMENCNHDGSGCCSSAPVIRETISLYFSFQCLMIHWYIARSRWVVIFSKEADYCAPTRIFPSGPEKRQIYSILPHQPKQKNHLKNKGSYNNTMTNCTSTHINDLPDDTLVLILSFLPAHIVVNDCMPVSSKWFNLVSYDGCYQTTATTTNTTLFSRMLSNGHLKNRSLRECIHFEQSDRLWEQLFQNKWMKSGVRMTRYTQIEDDDDDVDVDACWRDRYQHQLQHCYIRCRECHMSRSLSTRIIERSIVRPCQCPGYIDISCLDKIRKPGVWQGWFCNKCKSSYCLERSSGDKWQLHPWIETLIYCGLLALLRVFLWPCWEWLGGPNFLNEASFPGYVWMERMISSFVVLTSGRLAAEFYIWRVARYYRVCDHKNNNWTKFIHKVWEVKAKTGCIRLSNGGTTANLLDFFPQ